MYFSKYFSVYSSVYSSGYSSGFSVRLRRALCGLKTLGLLGSLALGLLAGFGPFSAQAEVSVFLARALQSAAGRYLLLETTEGLRLFETVLGSEATEAFNQRDLARLVRELGLPRNAALAERLDFAMRRVRNDFNRPRAAGERFETLATLAGRADLTENLRRLAMQEFGDFSGFLPQGPFRDTPEMRQLMMRGLELDLSAGQRFLRYPYGAVRPSRLAAARAAGSAGSTPGGSAGGALESQALRFRLWSEVPLEHSEPLLHLYSPASRFGISPESWHALSGAEKIRWVREHRGELAGAAASSATDGGLVRNASEAHLGFLSERLFLSESGAFRLQAEAVTSLEQWIGRAQLLQDTFPTVFAQAGMNAEVQVAREFFPHRIGTSGANENVGFLKWMSDLDRLESLPFSTGFARSTARSLTATAERGSEYVNLNIHSFGGGAEGAELAELADRVVRTTFFLQFGRSQFAGAVSLPAYRADSTQLSSALRTSLERIFPGQIDAIAYPLRSWSQQLQFMGAPQRLARVLEAQNTYRSELERLVSEVGAGRMSPQAAEAALREALGRFAEQSELTLAYREWLQAHLNTDPLWARYMRTAIHEIAPLPDAFPTEVWEGDLWNRVARLMERWPNHVRLVNRVGFGFQAGPGAATIRTERPVLLISTRALSDSRKSALISDYVNAMARGTVSFPLKESADHLRMRLGTRDFDWWRVLNTGAYRSSSSDRMEPIVALSPTEELRLRFYVEQALKDGQRVVGRRAILRGIADGRTFGRLRNNRPRSGREGHNCTSWVCTVQLGDNHQRLIEMVGATVDLEVHTNPGWWNHFLTGAASTERVPLVVYWSHERNLGELSAHVRSDANFPTWDFNLH
jgi:hypothetical protein